MLEARETRCDMRAQGTGARQTGRGAGAETWRERIGAIAPGDGARERVTPGRARTATGARREADREVGGLHGAGRTWRIRGEPVSVCECHREPLSGNLLHVG